MQKIKVYGKILLSYNVAGNFMPSFMPVFHVVELTSMTFCGFFCSLRDGNVHYFVYFCISISVNQSEN